MSPGGYPVHLTSLKESSAPLAPAEPTDPPGVFASGRDTVLAHREKITAGIPGCTCGESYPAAPYVHYAILHAQHVADQVVTRAVDAAIAAIRADLDDYARDPARWGAGSHDSAAAIAAIIKMTAREGGQSRLKESTTP